VIFLSAAPLSMDAIMQAVRATTEGRTMTLERIRASLNQMASDSVGYLSRTGDMGGHYAICILFLLIIDDLPIL
jgi:hypothetical protein